MLNNETILVFGATGNQGGAVIKTLISESERENKTITLQKQLFLILQSMIYHQQNKFQ